MSILRIIGWNMSANLELFADIFWPIFLIPLSILYNLIELRFFLYQKGHFKSHKLEGYTISVGNIEVGGTGKNTNCYRSL